MYYLCYLSILQKPRVLHVVTKQLWILGWELTGIVMIQVGSV